MKKNKRNKNEIPNIDELRKIAETYDVFFSDAAREIFDDFNSNFNDGVTYEPIYEKTDVDDYEAQAYALIRFSFEGTDYVVVSLYPTGRVHLHFSPTFRALKERSTEHSLEFDGRYEWSKDVIASIFIEVSYIARVYAAYIEAVEPIIPVEEKWDRDIYITE